MKPVFIYFKEIPFKDNNTFVLDFSDDEFVQKVIFKKIYKLLYCKLRV